MKKITFMLFSMLAVLAGFSSCSSNDNEDGQMTNYVSISVDGNSIINEDDEQAVTVNILLAYAPKSNATITLSLKGNDDNVATITPATVNIAAGEKTATVTVKSNNKHSLAIPCVLTIEATYSDANMKSDGKAATITINPDSDIPELTADQLKLIEGYKEKFNIDLTKLLGKINVSTVVTFNDDDKTETFASDESTRSFSGTTIITLSDKATADKPVLKMTSNAMGLATFNYEMLRKKTVEDTEYWMEYPESKAIMSVLNYDYSKETFTMTLDGIEVNTSDMSLSYTGKKITPYEEEITTIPFAYTWSAWSRMKQMADEGKTVIVDNGVGEDGNEQKVETAVSDIITGMSTLNPSFYFDNTDINDDAENTDYSEIFTMPTGKIDFSTGKMTFSFPWYLDNTYGCQRIDATYTFGK